MPRKKVSRPRLQVYNPQTQGFEPYEEQPQPQPQLQTVASTLHVPIPTLAGEVVQQEAPGHHAFPPQQQPATDVPVTTTTAAAAATEHDELFHPADFPVGFWNAPRQPTALVQQREIVAQAKKHDESPLLLVSDDGKEGHFLPSALGGTDVVRKVKRYAADEHSYGGNASKCTKHKESNNRLLPGCLFGWCLDCGACVGFTLMGNAESPRTVFEWLYTRCASPPELVCYDNGCNAQQFCLNREPEFFSRTRFYIDALHFRDHTKCSPEYCSTNCSVIKNSSLAEQKNAIIRSLERNCGYMTQLTFLWYVRFFVHRMNKVQRDKAAGKCFFGKRK